jgi:hypothetical protein
MKTKLALLLVFAALTASAQTNPVTEFRMVGKVKYDVSKPPFLDVTIPAESELMGAKSIHFNGEIKPISVSLVTPQGQSVSIGNFPYDPKYFRNIP